MSDLKQSFPSAPIIGKRELTPDPSPDVTPGYLGDFSQQQAAPNVIGGYLGDFSQQQERSRPPNEGLKSPAF